MMYGLLSSQDFDEFVDAHHINIREWGLFECSLLLVWRAHVFRFPLFHHVVVEHALIPKTVDGILSSLGEILAKHAANVLHFRF